MSSQILLKSLTLRNFKGIKDLRIDFSKVTNVFGDNGTGKTTINDSFSWLLFDKDSKDRKDFEIKTLAADGQPFHGLDHDVIGVLLVDGRPVTLQKTYREKWTKKRGEADKELTGHETLYYIDDVPVKKSEYQDKISSMIDENIFKLITNPLFFSAGMKWQDRRNVLLKIIGDITSDRIIGYKSNLRPLEALLFDNDADTLKKSIQARKRKLNDDLKQIPSRIDEQNRSIQELDFDFLERQVIEIKSAIKGIEEQMMDSSKVNDDVLQDRQRLFELKAKMQDLENKAKLDSRKPLEDIEKKIQQFNADLFKYQNINTNKLIQIDGKRNTIKDLDAEMVKLREEWGKKNQEQPIINENEFICPMCNRALEEHDIEHKREQMMQNFNSDKAAKLEKIQQQGQSRKAKVEQLQAEICALSKEVEENYSLIENTTRSIGELETIKANFDINAVALPPESADISMEIESLEEKLRQPLNGSRDLSDLKLMKNRREVELESVNKQLAFKEQNERTKARIAELLEEEKKLGKQIAELEGQEFLCEDFIKTKVELLENSINSKFKYVSFKLFETQVNGGLNETCEALINGVPFSNANTASQINAGIDIINALCEEYGVQAPIFIDNRESVNDIIPCNSQIINLIVSKDKDLRIESEVM